MLGVVFVHGFNSSPGMWDAFADLIAEDEGLTDVAVLRFGYATGLWRLPPLRVIPSPETAADSLKEFLTTEGGEYRSLVLVGHSQGGLVIQRALVRMLAEGRGRELARVRRVVLLACPNTGSQVLLALRRRVFRRNAQERALRPFVEQLADTRRILMTDVVHARELTDRTCPIAFSAYAGEEDGVVTPASARDVFPEAAVLPGDHVTIARPDSREHRSYTTLRRLLRAAADGDPPGGAGPGGTTAPTVTNLAPRNINFSGREPLLEVLRATLHAESAAGTLPTVAVHGLGGVGKSELVREFAHRFAADYDLVWWVPAESSASAVAALVGLADRLGLSLDGDDEAALRRLFDELRRKRCWLLVYDDAERPDALTGLLPSGGGHILITSRWSAWSAMATAVQLGAWARSESVAFLSRRTNSAPDDPISATLAGALGDLPLALEEAAAYLDETGVDLGRYLQLIRDRGLEVFGPKALDVADEPNHKTVASVWSVSLERIAGRSPAAEDMLNLLAFLGPQVPRALPETRPTVLGEPLAEVVADKLAYDRLVAVIRRYSLIAADPDYLNMHPLVQQVVRARMGAEGERSWAATALTLLVEVFPVADEIADRRPECETLLPHVLAVERHARRLGIEGEHTGALLDRASTHLRGRGLHRLALPLAERGLSDTGKALGFDHPDVAWRRDELGMARLGLGDTQAARAQFEAALSVTGNAVGPQHPDMATRHGNVGRALHAQRALSEARIHLTEALRISRAARGPDHPDVGTRHGNLGLVLLDLGDTSQAGHHLREALRISTAAHGPEHLTAATWHGALGALAKAQGDLPAALAHAEHALGIGTGALGPDHPSVGSWHNNLGAILRDLEDTAGARRHLETALRIGGETLHAEHPTLAVRHGNLGLVLRDHRDLTAARGHLEEAVRILVGALGGTHPEVIIWRAELGRVYQELGDFAGAERELGEIRAAGETVLGPDHPQVRAGTPANPPRGDAPTA